MGVLKQQKHLTVDDLNLRVEAAIQNEKLRELEQLETDLVELNAAFGEMNQLIAMQDDEIENTLDTSDRVQEKVDRGSGRLRYAREKGDSNRNNLIYVIVVFFVILGIGAALVFILLR